MSGLMAGKRGLIMGLANDKSLAWGISKQLADAGAELAFSYQGEALGKRVRPLAEQVGSDFVVECDVGDMAKLDETFDAVGKRWDGLDFVVHAIGFSDKNELRGGYVDTSLDKFPAGHEIRLFVSARWPTRAGMMKRAGRLLTLTIMAPEGIPHYNVMVVAKAALETSVKYLAADLGPEGSAFKCGISAGPIKTPRARAASATSPTS